MLDSYDPLTFEPRRKLSKFFNYFGGPLQFFAFIITAFGALLVAQLSQNLRFYGFGLWVISNTLWVIWALLNRGNGGILFTYVINFILNFWGIYNNFPHP